MNIGNLTIGIILAIICILPFVILSQQRKNKKKNRLKNLSIVASNQNCKINQHEFCGDYLIGIDNEKGVLFFNKQFKEKNEESSVQLSEFKECKILTRYQDIKDQSFKEVEQLSLSFIPLVKGKSEVKLLFFDAEINMMLSGELDSIKKWQDILTKQMTAKA